MIGSLLVELCHLCFFLYKTLLGFFGAETEVLPVNELQGLENK